MQAPCKGCEDRHEGCHVTCGKYQEFYNHIKKAQKERSDEKIVSDYFGDRKIKVARIFTKKPGRM